MRPEQASLTALINAAFRASESAKPAGKRLFKDPYAAGFLTGGLRALAGFSTWPVVGRALTAAVDLRWPGSRTSLVARTRLIDGWIEEIAQSEALAPDRQLVVLGAGFDSRAWRLPELKTWRVFEVDHPATSLAKRRRVANLGADGGHVTFVPVDFDRERISEALNGAGFDGTRRSIVLWDGVSNYLQPEAVDAVAAWAGRLAPGGTFIFTYVDANVLADEAVVPGAREAKRAVSGLGEPWTFGFRPDAVAGYLAERGLKLLADLNADEYRLEVMGSAARRIHGYGFYHAVRAKVVGA